MNLNDFFPHKVCINLDKRRDRWERMQAKFAAHNINRVIRFPALDGKTLKIPDFWDDFPGAYGCLRSHLAVVEQAHMAAKPSVLIFEDDAVLHPQINAKFSEYIDQLSEDWDMLLFGGIHGKPFDGASRNVVRVTSSLSTYAYALKHTIYESFIELNRKALTVLDENTRALQEQFNCYCFVPHLAWVDDDYSDVREDRSHPWWLKESLVLWGREVESILEKTAAVISYRHRSEASLENLRFIVNYFSKYLPTVAVLVVAEAESPGLDPKKLSEKCRFEFVRDASGLERSRVFDLGFEIFAPSKDCFLFQESDIFLTRDDIRANLLMCREFEFASAFSQMCELNEADTMKILNNDMRWEYNGNFKPRKKADICDFACIFTSNGMRRIGSWKDNPESNLISKRVRQLLRVYESPNLARRLFSG